MARLVSKAGLSNSKRLGSDLMLLVGGANARATVDGNLAPATDARRLPAMVIDAFRGQQA